MTITEAADAREIAEILHFTTNRGLTGTAYKRELLSRRRLSSDETLEHILQINAVIRRDVRWLGHVNLSISRINQRLFQIASERWYAGTGLWWCVLSFRPEILSHPGVWFATTNNIYEPAHGDALPGFQALFAENVHQYGTESAYRWRGMPLRYTTCRQAEVLYPEGVPTVDYLQRIYVREDDHIDTASAILKAQHHPPVEIVANENIFR